MPTQNQLGELIDVYYKVREEKRKLDAASKDLAEKLRALEQAIVEGCKSQGLDGARGKLATASFTEKIFPSVKDWDKFAPYVYRHKALHLLERRVAVAAYREAIGDETTARLGIPGIEPFTKPILSLKTRGQ